MPLIFLQAQALLFLSLHHVTVYTLRVHSSCHTYVESTGIVLASGSSSLLVVAATPVPLGLDFDSQPQAADAAHFQRLDKAKNDANAQIRNMQATLANPTDPVNAQRIHDAFGPKANLAEIQNTVNRLDTGRLRVASADPQVADTAKGRPTLAKVSLNKNPDGSFNSMGSALIGSRFHKDTLSDKQRAGTLIHEATHQQSRTGDDVVTQGMGAGIVLPAGVRPAGPAAHGVNANGGYARADSAQINSAADLSNEYKTLRDSSPNMHQNADSYRVFGALCSRSLYKRALSQEDPVGYYLARRSQCTLPPDYFAKKAAAKAAAAKTTVGPSKAPTTKGAMLTTTKGANSKTATAKTTKSKGLTTQRAGKGSRASMEAKAVKGARKVTKGTGIKAVRNPLTKAAKGVKGAKVAKGAKPLKGVKATKATKGLKVVKAGKGVKATKATKGVKATKASKAVQGAKSLKGVKSTKPFKISKGSKVTLGNSSNARKAGKSTASSKVSSKSSTKASPERSVKVTKPAARVAVASPRKKGGKKARRDLESVLEELD